MVTLRTLIKVRAWSIFQLSPFASGIENKELRMLPNLLAPNFYFVFLTRLGRGKARRKLSKYQQFIFVEKHRKGISQPALKKLLKLSFFALNFFF